MKTHPQITPLFYNVQDVGKNIKQTKKRFTWILQINNKIYNFVLDASMISGKVKLTCNTQIVAMAEEQPLGTFQHSMLLDDCQITILAITDSYEMRINNQVFSHMLDQQKNKKEFIKNQQAVQDFVLDKKITGSSSSNNGLKKTIKLKIGSMNTSNEKSSIKSMESQDWNKMMSGQQNSFPNYFDISKGGVDAKQMDITKISMKKKSVQPQTSQLSSQTPSLIQSETQVIEITPEQFCTMQQLFRTQVPIQTHQTQIPSIIEQHSNCLSISTGVNPNDFSTMQMLFQTQSGQPPKVNENVSTQPIQININAQEFSTMQWMFNTMNVGTPSATTTPIILQKKQEIIPKASSLLDQLCSPSTNTSHIQSLNHQSNQSIQQINMSDFNTMQMMFRTNNISSMFNQQTNIQEPVYVNQITTEPKVCEQKSQIVSEPNPMDFSTMANMFKTVNLSQIPALSPIIKQPTIQASSVDPFECLGLSNSSNNVNIQNINMSDFSTMQMLFKTNGVGISNNMAKKQASSTNELKQNSIPFQFQF